MNNFQISSLVVALAAIVGTFSSSAEDFSEWRIAGGDPTGSQFSSLTQITPDNAHQLEVAWVYHSGDGRSDNRSQIQCNPIIVGGTIYATTPALKLVALDAATGVEKWRFDPFKEQGADNAVGVNRGVVYWENESGCEARILFTAGQGLYAVEASKGRLISEFGEAGRKDLREGLGWEASQLYVLSNSPGAIYEDLLILGTRVSEGPGPSAPGHIRAYDVRDGSIQWVFHTIPQPGEFGYDTWPEDAWKRVGGANAWSGISVDQERGWVFLPTGSPAFDFWGGDRHGSNLFGNCILALNARTGERIWHYQVVHHDLWDRDLPAAPNLVTVEHCGKRIDAVAQITKSGHVFVLNRETGEPLFPVEETPVPPSDLRGEQAWSTQPLPLKPPPFARQVFLESDITTISSEETEWVREKFKTIRTGLPFIPPSEVGTVIFPGFDGGGEWGGAAFDPRSGILFVNSNEMPWILTMVDLESSNQEKQVEFSPGENVYRQFCSACHGIDRLGDPQKAFPGLAQVNEKMNAAQIVELLNTGRGVMPSFGFLSPLEKEALAQFLSPSADSNDERAVARTETKQKNSNRKKDGSSPYTHTGYNRFITPAGYPAIQPPWGQLNAINLNTGKIEWQVPLGSFQELDERGVPTTGTENYGGPAVTAGGVIFIGASKDEKFRAFDSQNGQVLFEHPLPAGGYATPSVYEVAGRQYVVIAAGGGKMGTGSGDAYVAFALPKAPDTGSPE